MEIYSKYKPSSILDFCAGWGGRLIGACALNVPEYIGIDINGGLEQYYNKISDFFADEERKKRLKVKTQFKMFYESAITFDYSKIEYDMVLTSPPYYFLEKYFKGHFYYKILITLGITIAILIISLILVHFMINKQNYDYGDINDVFDASFKKNLYYFIFYFILLIIYTVILYIYAYKSSKNQILQPALLGLFLMLFVFSFIIYICKNIGLINGYQYLDTFIVLLSIFIICGYIYFYLLLKSISSVCSDDKKKEESANNMNEAETAINIMLIALFGVLWIGDSKIWNQFEYLIFIIITVISFAGLFYYSTKYPSTGVISLWLFIEWIMLCFKNGNNAKNSLEGVFRKKIYRKHYE
jgi:hypothetical protein